jgi:hypothetical protein
MRLDGCGGGARLSRCETQVPTKTLLRVPAGIQGLFDVTPQGLVVLMTHHRLEFTQGSARSGVETGEGCPQAMGCEVTQPKLLGGCHEGFAKEPGAVATTSPGGEDQPTEGLGG